ncbi:MAG: hypothetical protein JWP35_4468 [Caulobacter sp.]|nr:hypothetical protein [Caulobacter sp.]
MRLTVAMLSVLVMAAACAKAPPPQPVVVVQPSQLEALVYRSSSLSERRISIDGYVGFDNGPSGQGAAMGPELTSAPNDGGSRLIRVEIERGAGPNQLNLPILSRQKIDWAPAAPETLIVDLSHATYQDASGAAHPLASRVRVTGRLEYFRLGSAGLLSDPDPSSPTGRRFKPRLVDVVLEPAR